MSTFKPPVGRRSAAVYRRRRLLVLLVLIAAVVLVVLMVARPWRGSAKSGGGQASAVISASPSVPPTQAPRSTSTPTAQPSSTPTGTATTPAAAAAGQPCDPARVDVQAITDASRYGAGQRPLLSLSLTNTGSQMCTIDAGTATMVFTITSGSEQYWSSKDCQTNPVHTVIKLGAHQTLTSVPIAWDRTRSSKSTCNSTSRPQAPAGGASYHLAVAVDGIASKATKQFLLTG